MVGMRVRYLDNVADDAEDDEVDEFGADTISLSTFSISSTTGLSLEDILSFFSNYFIFKRRDLKRNLY